MLFVDNDMADNGKTLFYIVVQILFCIFVSFINNGQVQLFWLLYQMPYIYWWLMKDYSMPPYICIQFPNLMTGVQNYYSDYCNCPYMSLFMCTGVCVE